MTRKESAAETNTSPEMVPVWDPIVRIFHWSLVVAFVVACLSAEEAEGLHLAAGYGVLGLVAVRFIWGFIGTQHARFSDFLYSPRAVFAYLKALASGDPPHYRGHNPAGGWMAVALLVGLVAISVSGVMLDAGEEGGLIADGLSGGVLVGEARADEARDDDEGAYEGGERDGGEEWWEEVHEATVNATLFLIVLHIAGVLISSVVHRENLVRAMVTGRKPS